MKISSVFVATLLLTTGFVITLAEDEPSPFLDMASEFLQATLANQNGGGGGIGVGIGIGVFGSLMQGDASGSGNGGAGAAQIISGIGALLQNMNNQGGGSDKNSGGSGGSGGGLDPTMLINMVSMFASTMNQDTGRMRGKRASESETPTMDAILSMATTFLSNMNKNEGNARGEQGQTKPNEGAPSWIELLPTVIKAVQTFTGPAMEEVEKKHKSHAHVLPPFLEHLHIMWDQFQNSELAQALFSRIGLDKVFKVSSF